MDVHTLMNNIFYNHEKNNDWCVNRI